MPRIAVVSRLRLALLLLALSGGFCAPLVSAWTAEAAAPHLQPVIGGDLLTLAEADGAAAGESGIVASCVASVICLGIVGAGMGLFIASGGASNKGALGHVIQGLSNWWHGASPAQLDYWSSVEHQSFVGVDAATEAQWLSNMNLALSQGFTPVSYTSWDSNATLQAGYSWNPESGVLTDAYNLPANQLVGSADMQMTMSTCSDTFGVGIATYYGAGYNATYNTGAVFDYTLYEPDDTTVIQSWNVSPGRSHSDPVYLNEVAHTITGLCSQIDGGWLHVDMKAGGTSLFGNNVTWPLLGGVHIYSNGDDRFGVANWQNIYTNSQLGALIAPDSGQKLQVGVVADVSELLGAASGDVVKLLNGVQSQLVPGSSAATTSATPTAVSLSGADHTFLTSLFNGLTAASVSAINTLVEPLSAIAAATTQTTSAVNALPHEIASALSPTLVDPFDSIYNRLGVINSSVQAIPTAITGALALPTTSAIADFANPTPAYNNFQSDDAPGIVGAFDSHFPGCIIVDLSGITSLFDSSGDGSIDLPFVYSTTIHVPALSSIAGVSLPLSRLVLVVFTIAWGVSRLRAVFDEPSGGGSD